MKVPNPIHVPAKGERIHQRLKINLRRNTQLSKNLQNNRIPQMNHPKLLTKPMVYKDYTTN
jgi:hypothetical protein